MNFLYKEELTSLSNCVMLRAITQDVFVINFLEQRITKDGIVKPGAVVEGCGMVSSRAVR